MTYNGYSVCSLTASFHANHTAIETQLSPKMIEIYTQYY